ncbi:MAG: UbiA family prenyltransferase [Candidatus Woesearchaeota archaeon]
MVYKKYIKRGGKKFGPYYFKSVRTQDGKVKSVYLGTEKPKASSLLTALLIGVFFVIFALAGYFSYTGLDVVDIVDLISEEEVSSDSSADSEEVISEEVISEEEIIDDGDSGGEEEVISDGEILNEINESEIIEEGEINESIEINETELNESVETNETEVEINESETNQTDVNATEINQSIEINESVEINESIGGIIIPLNLSLNENNISGNFTNVSFNISGNLSNISSNVSLINISDSGNETTTYYNVTINQPVRWEKRIKLNKETSNLTIKLPGDANITSVKEIKNNVETEIEFEEIGDIVEEESDSGNLITGNVVKNIEKDFEKILKFLNKIFSFTGLVIYEEKVKNNDKEIKIGVPLEEVKVEYLMPGPVSDESYVDNFRKIITISSEEHYVNILAYTNLSDVNLNSVRLYHLVNDSKKEVSFDAYDLNENGLVDYIEWIVPSLSNETYEVSITILNVRSYPMVGGNWTVMFNTTGEANLSIRTIEGTEWSNENENYDLKFLEVKCGDNLLDYSWINDSVFISDYSCNETGYEFSKVLTSGGHYLEFNYGGQIAYANNTAYNYSSGKLSAFETIGIPISLDNYTSQASSSGYTNLTASDDSHWVTDLATADGEYDSQIFVFNTTDIYFDNLTVTWEGYGETQAGYYTNISFWNWTGSQWYQVNATDFTSAADQTLYGFIGSGINNFINSSDKRVAVLVSSVKYAAGAVSCGEGHFDNGDGTCRAILRPNAAGISTNYTTQYPDSGSHYDKVNESVADDDTTYVAQTSIQPLVYMGHSRCVLENSIVTCGVGMSTPTSYLNFSSSWTTRPSDSNSWEISDIDSLQIGIHENIEGGYGVTELYDIPSSNIPTDSMINSVTVHSRAKSVSAGRSIDIRITLVFVEVNYSLPASPFLYGYDGNEYYKISDFIPKANSVEKEYVSFTDISNLKNNNGNVKLKITEELDETTYLDYVYLRIDNDKITGINISNYNIQSLLEKSDNNYLIVNKGDEYYIDFTIPYDYTNLEFAAEGYYIKNNLINEFNNETFNDLGKIQEKNLQANDKELIRYILIFVFVISLLGLLIYTGLKNKYINDKLANCNAFFSKIENIRAPILLWIVSFLSITLIRDFLENIIETPSLLLSWLHHFEFSFFWIALFFSITLFLAFVSKENISKVSKIVTFGWLITLIAPLLDAILYFNKHFIMTYIFNNILKNYFSFYNSSLFNFGATIGIKIEIAIICFMVGVYILSKTKSWIRTLISILGVYTIIFFYMALPAIFDFVLSIFNIDYTLKYPLDFFIILFVISVITIIIFLLINHGIKIQKFIDFKFFKINKKICLILLKNIRLFRTIHYSLLTLLGISLAIFYKNGNIMDLNILKIIFLLLSMIFAWLFAVGLNDLFDVKIDKISNKNRPLISGIINKETYKIYILLFFILSVLFAAFVNYYSTNLIIYFMIAYSFIYSAPPFRFRKYFLIPNVLIGLCSLLAVLFGASLILGENTFSIIPSEIILLIFFIFTISSTLKDIKDYYGDKFNSIKTIPTIFGLNNGKRIIGILLAASFILVPIFYPIKYLIFVSIPFAVLAYLFVIKKNEKWIFILEFIFMVILIILLIFSSTLINGNLNAQDNKYSNSDNINFASNENHLHNTLYTDYIELNSGTYPAPSISFSEPTPANATSTLNTSFIINVSINDSGDDINQVIYNWNGTNYSIYDDNLVLMYNFDNVSEIGEDISGEGGENSYLVDLSGYNNSGSSTAGYSMRWNSSGKYGGAGRFSTGIADDGIQVNDSGSLKPANITIAAWVYRYDWHIYGSVVSKMSNGNWEDGYMLGSIETNNDIAFWVTNYTNIATTTIADDNKWIYLTGVYNGTTVMLYIDGILVDSSVYTDGITHSNGILQISQHNIFVTGWNGLIDEVRIWNKSLSPDEIQFMYKSNLNKYDSGKWNLNINQTKNATSVLDKGNYTYQTFAIDSFSATNSTEVREITIGDFDSPNVTLESPDTGYVTISPYVSLTCNATDNGNLNNISLYTNQTGSWMLNQSVGISGNSSVKFNLTNVTNGGYIWNCLAYDTNDNSDWGNSNWTVNISNRFRAYEKLGTPTDDSDFDSEALEEDYNALNSSDLVRWQTDLSADSGIESQIFVFYSDFAAADIGNLTVRWVGYGPASVSIQNTNISLLNYVAEGWSPFDGYDFDEAKDMNLTASTTSPTNYVQFSTNKVVVLVSAEEGAGLSGSLNSNYIVLDVYAKSTIKSGPTLIPTTAKLYNNLNCTFTLTDKDNVTILANYTWYQDGVVQLSGQDEVINNTEAIIYLGSGNTSNGENWTCGIIPYDGISYGTGVNSSVSFITNNVTCGDNITGPGSYRINASVSDYNSDCIIIDSDDVELDCGNYALDGTISGNAIYSARTSGNELTNITIRNCHLSDFNYGVYWAYVDESFIYNTSGDDADVHGFLISNSDNNYFDNLTATANGFEGFSTNVITYNNFTNLTLHTNSRDGIVFSNADFNIVKDSRFYANVRNGLYLSGSDYNAFYNLTIEDQDGTDDRGIYSFSGNDYNNFSDSIIRDNYDGIVSNGSFNNNNFTRMNITNNSNYGIYFSVSTDDNNFVYDNFFNNSNNAPTVNGADNFWNATKESGTNIISGSFIAGNYWANPTETGYSENCTDSSGDGICEAGYNLGEGEIDYMPLTYNTNLAPNVTLESPDTTYNTISPHISLTCNASEDVNLKNLTLYTNQSGYWTSNLTIDVSGTSGIVKFNLTNVTNGGYIWNCLAYDAEGTSDWASANWSFTINNSFIAYENLGVPTVPSDFDNTSTEDDYNAVNSSDNTRWSTTLAATDGEIDSQIFVYTINYTDVANLTVTWEGYGETEANYLTNISFWNWTGAFWYQVNYTDFTGATDQTVLETISSGANDFINSSDKRVAVLVSSRKYVGANCGNGILEGDEVCDSGQQEVCEWTGGYWYDSYVEDGITCAGNEGCNIDCTACINWDDCHGLVSPFVYIYKNEEYKFNSDFIAGATAPEKEYESFTDISNSEIENNKIKLKITEELDETTYLDKIYLLVNGEKVIELKSIGKDKYGFDDNLINKILLSKSDNNYLIMNQGDEYYLEFNAPKEYKKIEFAAEGYYIEHYKNKNSDYSHNSVFTDTIELEYVADLTPNASTPIIYPSTAYTDNALNCTFTIIDPDNATVLANYNWFNNTSGDVYETGQLEVKNGTTSAVNLTNTSDTYKQQEWICEIIPSDGDNVGDGYNSTSVQILNTLPTQVTLSSPEDENVTRDRSPTFIWNNASDSDNDIFNFQIQVDDDSGFGAPEINVSEIEALTYTPVDGTLSLDTNYYWKVRAADSGFGAGNGTWSATWNFTIESLLSISLVTDSLDFGNLAPGATDNSTDNTPSPFVVENDGNVLTNVSVNASQLFEQALLGEDNYQFKADSTGEAGSFNTTGSITTWTSIIADLVVVIRDLLYNAASDTAEVDILLTTPIDEPVGFKTSEVVFKGVMSEV